MILPQSKLVRVALAVIMCIVAWNFKTNGLGLAPEPFFSEFQMNGQARVLGGVYARMNDLPTQSGNLGHLYPANVEFVPEDTFGNVARTVEIFDLGSAVSGPVAIESYQAQFGGQVYVYSWAYQLLGLQSYQSLEWIPAILAALVIGLLSLGYWRLINPAFGILFFAGLAGSPWFVAFAHNLYWNPFLIFLPGLFALWASLAQSRTGYLCLLGLTGLAVMIKSLNNYEYLTCAVVLACAPFLVGPHFGNIKLSWSQGIGKAVTIFIVCCVGFAAAFSIHAMTRGDGLVDGMTRMYHEDVSRRTFGDSAALEGEAAESLDASLIDTFEKYLTLYPETRRTIIPRSIAVTMFLLTLFGFAFAFLVRRQTFPWGTAWLFATFIAVPLSWIIAAKGHAYTQTHIGYVTFYFGLFQALIYGFVAMGWHDLMLLKSLLTGHHDERR